MKLNTQTITLNGKAYVVVPKEQFEAMETLVKMPDFPQARQDGNYPAREFMRVSIARDIIKERARLGLSQAELARRARVRVETLNRIESGKHTPTVPTIDKIDRALKAAEGKRSAKARA
jgi:ribosome-binding protein aMBF1 (putative translation factor)